MRRFYAYAYDSSVQSVRRLRFRGEFAFILKRVHPVSDLIC